MNSLQKRNLRILEMHRDGLSRADIARRVGLSPTSISVILRQSEERARVSQRTAILLRDLRSIDDLDALWPTTEFVDAFWFSPKIRAALLGHFQRVRMEQISLRTLMDLAVPGSPERGGSDAVSPPLLRVWLIGSKGFWSVVNRLTDFDLGDRCNKEWETRLNCLRQSWKIRGRLPYSQK